MFNQNSQTKTYHQVRKSTIWAKPLTLLVLTAGALAWGINSKLDPSVGHIRVGKLTKEDRKEFALRQPKFYKFDVVTSKNTVGVKVSFIGSNTRSSIALPFLKMSIATHSNPSPIMLLFPKNTKGPQNIPVYLAVGYNKECSDQMQTVVLKTSYKPSKSYGSTILTSSCIPVYPYGISNLDSGWTNLEQDTVTNVQAISTEKLNTFPTKANSETAMLQIKLFTNRKAMKAEMAKQK